MIRRRKDEPSHRKCLHIFSYIAATFKGPMNKKIHGKLLSEFHHVTELFLQHGRGLVNKLTPSSTEVLYTLLVKQGTKDEI